MKAIEAVIQSAIWDVDVAALPRWKAWGTRGLRVLHAVVNDLPLGRSVDEALRMLDALRFTEEHGEVCPANWKAGDEAMKPMVLKDVAEEIGMHESTISRVTTNKYMHTPRGVFEFKYFFSSHLSSANGEDQSSTSVRAKIRKLIGAENPTKPLSDSKLADLLASEGIKVARRTVAKYREAMNIASSSERRQRPAS